MSSCGQNNVVYYSNDPLQTYSVEFSIDSQIPYPVCSCPDGFELICHVQSHLADTRNWREGERGEYIKTGCSRAFSVILKLCRSLYKKEGERGGPIRGFPASSNKCWCTLFLNKQMIKLKLSLQLIVKLIRGPWLNETIRRTQGN